MMKVKNKSSINYLWMNGASNGSKKSLLRLMLYPLNLKINTMKWIIHSNWQRI